MKTGSKHSIESKEKMRQAMLGRPAWNKGVSRTEEEKQKMRDGISEEERKKRSDRMKKKWVDGDYDKIFKGDNNPSKRPEVAKKIGEANSKRVWTEESKEKSRQARLGKPRKGKMSDKSLKEMSERMKVDNPMYRKEVLENHPVLKGGRHFVSEGEEKLAEIFTDLGLTFERQKLIEKPVGYYSADFFFSPDKIIEFDGHNTHRENPEVDERRDEYTKSLGYKTLRLVSPDLNLSNRKKLTNRIMRFINGRTRNPN